MTFSQFILFMLRHMDNLDVHDNSWHDDDNLMKKMSGIFLSSYQTNSIIHLENKQNNDSNEFLILVFSKNEIIFAFWIQNSHFDEIISFKWVIIIKT